jgi:hypothetical protein
VTRTAHQSARADRSELNPSWSALGPHGIGNRWSSAGTSGQDARARIAGHSALTATTSDAEAGWGRVRIPPDHCAGRVLSPAGIEIRKTLETRQHLGTTAAIVGGLLTICWQRASQRSLRNPFVLVGVTGIEPVTSAV